MKQLGAVYVVYQLNVQEKLVMTFGSIDTAKALC